MNEPFDDILKRKWEAQQFPVDESHRQDMIALLDGHKRRRVLPFWWISGLIIVTALSGLLLFQQLSSPPAVPTPATAPVTTPPVTSGSTLAKHDEKQQAGQLDPSQGSGSSQTQVSSENIGAPKPDVSKASNITSHSKSSASKKTTDISASKSTPSHTTRISENSKSTSSGNTNAPATKAQFYTVDEDAATSYQIVSQPVAVIVEPDDAAIDATSTAPAANRTLGPTQDIQVLGIDGISYLSAEAPLAIRAASSFHASFHVFAEAGAGMVLPSKPDYSMGWKLRAGAGVGYRVSPKIALTWSAGYLMQAGGFDFQRSSVVSQPGFGTRSSFNTLTPDKLHYVYSRIGAMYHIHRHILGGHGGLQYLYGTQGHIEVQTMDQLVPGLTPVSSYSWLKKDGLRELLWTADLWYGYQISPRLVASAGTDMYFSSFTIEDEALASEGYSWNGTFATFHPFITLNYLLYGRP